MPKKKKERTIEDLHETFVAYVENTYDNLSSMFRSGTIKRVTMDRNSYLNAAERFFEEFCRRELDGVPIGEDTIWDLIEGFDEDTEIVVWVLNQNT